MRVTNEERQRVIEVSPQLARHALVVALICAIAGIWASAALAHPAHPNYVDTGSEFQAADGFANATRLAVDPSTHEILVVDSGLNRVVVFEPDGGTSATQVLAFGEETLSSPYGIAIDQPSGDVYVSDAGNNRVVRFHRSDSPTLAYTLDPSYAGPPLGSGAGQVGSFAAALAIDPGTHDLLVADRANRLVSRYAPDGSFVRSIAGTGDPDGALVDPADLAVGPDGTTHVVDLSDPFNSVGKVFSFGRDGSPQGVLPTDLQPGSVAVVPDSGMLVVGGHNTPDASTPRRLYSFIDGSRVAEVDVGGFVLAVFGVAIDGGPAGRLYVLIGQPFGLSGFGPVRVYTPVLAPGVELQAPTNLGATTVRLSGTVDPGGKPTVAHFEYSVDGVAWTSTPDQDLGSGTGEQPVEADVADLDPNREYFVRLVAANDETESRTERRSVTTSPLPPGVSTGVAMDVDTSSATLTGRVNPYGMQATYHFEYGETAAYGARVPIHQAVAGNGRSPRWVSERVGGLRPGTTYHYRLVATSAEGTAEGEDRTVTIPATAVGARGWEMVTPVDKGGASPRVEGYTHASLDGDRVNYGTRSVFPGFEGSAPSRPDFEGIRRSDGWATVALDAPQLVPDPFSLKVQTVLGASDDGTKVLVSSNRGLTPGAVDGDNSLYVRDTATGDYTLVATTSHWGLDYTGLDGAYTGFVDASRDFSTVVFDSYADLIDDGVSPWHSVYAWSPQTGVRLVSVLPDGTPASDASAMNLPNAVSEEGEAIIFAASGIPYVREGDATRALTVSQRAGGSTDPIAATPTAISPDGTTVTFLASGPGLTDDAPEFVNGYYRYDLGTGVLTFLFDAGSSYFWSMSGDTRSIYYVLGSDVHEWRQGETRQVGGIEFTGTGLSARSPNGKYTAFTSVRRLTDADNTGSPTCPASIQVGNEAGSCRELYVYDWDADELTCVSCRSDGGRSVGHAGIGQNPENNPFGNRLPRAVTDNGHVFFDTPNPLVPADVNGTRDVYEVHDGEVRLISRGKQRTSAYFADSDLDGSDVFFITDDPLVGQDVDTSFDVYDARVGGGIPAQSPRRMPPPCSGGDCDGTSSLPSGSALPTSAYDGPGNVRPALKARVTSLRSARGRALKLRVRVPAKGRIVVSGAGLRVVKKTARRAGTYRLRIGLSARAKRELRHRRRLRLSVRVAYIPAGGSSSTTTASLTLKAK